MRPDRRSAHARWTPAAVAATAVIAASLLPADGGGTATTLLGVGADKWLHAAGYAVIAVLADGADAADAGHRRPWPVVVAAVALLGFGVELAQLPLATRAFSLLDAAANAVGATVGVAIHRLAWAVRTPHGDRPPDQ